MCKSILTGQNVPGTDGTYHGTDGMCPRDRRDAHQGVSRQNSLCLLVFFFPHVTLPRNRLTNPYLGGHFGPEKKYLVPPPKLPKSAQTPSRPLGPSWRPPPLVGFSIKNLPPPLPAPSDSPFPVPQQKKIKNIRNVRQVIDVIIHHIRRCQLRKTT